jgi:UDP-N-acetylenolpyruvoylglucosamine reductase
MLKVEKERLEVEKKMLEIEQAKLVIKQQKHQVYLSSMGVVFTSPEENA